MAIKIKIGSVSRSVTVNEDDETYEFKHDGLIVQEIEFHIWNELDHEARDKLRYDWVHDKITEEELMKTVEGIYEEFD